MTLEEAARDLCYTIDSVAAGHMHDWTITPADAERLSKATLKVKEFLYGGVDPAEYDAEHHPDERVREIARRFVNG